MKQLITKIIAMMTVFCAIITVMPSAEVKFFTTEAYALTGDLSSLKLKTSGGSNIKIYDNSNYKSKNEVDDDEIEKETRYYAKTSSSKIKVAIKGVDEDNVRLFASEKDSAKGVKVGKTIELPTTTNKVTVRVYKSDPGSSVKYKDDDDVSCDYTIRVKYTGDNDDDDDNDEDYDDVYLKNITLSSGDINFSKKTTKYNVYVDSSVDEIKIKAKPDDDDYTVTIDGTEVDDDDDYKETVSLNKGKNTIEIEVEDEDEDEYRIYTLYIYRGEIAGSTNTSLNNNTNIGNNVSRYNPITSSPVISTQPNYQPTNSKVNQWTVTNGKWQYLDSLGRPLTSQWFLDNNSGKYYYLGADGNMATGWIYMSGKWYMLDNSGAMLTGWQYSGGKWYYLNPQNGEMVTNSYVGSYKVDSTGALVR
ncbi:cadherin-like beta sandwich domain-containing protein [uncultured Clostridium sp.]|uniref:N-acetylmuramoyl-L-alanine amidase family protein n=1 Tax=uncultured Clostridium sp. TaxID=59620 RepID=UPI0025EDAB71|nr:cadherin-like beta sandwich domain-containing protein [uncultured Clostridium sp.]